MSRSVDGLYLNTGSISPRRGGTFYYTLAAVQQTEGVNNGERNNFIFSRRACGGGNFNGSFVTQFNGGDHDGTSVLEPLRSQRLSMDRTGADVFQRTASLRPNYRSPQKFKPARLPTLPFEAYSASTRSFLQSSQLPDITPAALPAQGDQTRPRTSSSFMSVSGSPARLAPMSTRRVSPSLR